MGDVLVPEVWRCPPARPGWMGGKRAAVGNLSPLLPPSRVLRGGGHGRATGMSQSWPTRCIRVGCGARSVVDRRQTLGSSEGSHSQSRRAACGVHSLHLPAASEPESRSESVTVGTAATPWARRPCKGPGVVTARGSGRSDGWPGAVTCDGPGPAGPCRHRGVTGRPGTGSGRRQNVARPAGLAGTAGSLIRLAGLGPVLGSTSTSRAGMRSEQLCIGRNKTGMFNRPKLESRTFGSKQLANTVSNTVSISLCATRDQHPVSPNL